MKIIASLLIAILASASAHKFNVCTGAEDHLAVSGVTLNPDPVVAGQELKVELDGTSAVAISAGTANVQIIAFGVPIAKLNLDICKDLGLTCPVKAGDAIKAAFTYKIPALAKGINTASAKLTVTAADNSAITCVEIPIGDINAEETTLLRSSGPQPLDREQVEYFFETWKREFNIDFDSADEYLKRLNVFSDNLELINTHNAKGESWTMGLNEFAHQTWHEFRSTHLGFSKPNVIVPIGVKHNVEAHADAVEADLDSSVDWTQKGAVTVVKNQAQCGSCWAFSTTGGLEGAYFLKYGKLPNNDAQEWTQAGFSEQMLVDCDTTDNGCNGGLMDNAFRWIKKNGGICLEKDYAYTASTGTCDDSSCTVVEGTDLKEFTDVAQSKTALMSAVARGPVSIAIEADQSGFQFYNGGVFTGECGTQLDHGVLVVGYGTEDQGDFWRVKNSWGATWGDSGYINLQRGKSQDGGQCGILMSASYPTL